MRFSRAIVHTVRLLTQDEAASYCGGAQLLSIMENAGWVKPAVRQRRLKRWDIKALDTAIDRLVAGEWPKKI